MFKWYKKRKLKKQINKNYDEEINLSLRELVLNMKLDEEEKKRKEYYESRNI